MKASGRVSGARRILALGVWLACGAATAEAQIERRISTRVTAVSGDAIFVDGGRESRFEPGDRVIVRPPSGSPVVGRLTVVSRTSSRAELPAGGPRIDIGRRCG